MDSVYIGGLRSQTTLRCLTHLVNILLNTEDFKIAYVSNKDIVFPFTDILKQLNLENEFVCEGDVFTCLKTGSSVTLSTL